MIPDLLLTVMRVALPTNGDEHKFVLSLERYHYHYIVSNNRYKRKRSVIKETETAQLFKNDEQCKCYNFLGGKNMNDVTVTIFEGTSNKNDVTVTIFYLVSDGR
jgi:hypothetical protein